MRRVIATCIGCAVAVISEKESECGGEIVNVFAASLMNVAAGQEMNVRCLKTDVPLNLPVQIHIERSANITRSVWERRNGNAARDTIDGVVSRISPEPVCTTIYGDAL